MRVVAGNLRGRRIEGPPEEPKRSASHSANQSHTRPTTDKVREAVFNSLGSMGVVDGVCVVDLFAGSGALGIEALSRGASKCVFVENNKVALAALRKNVTTLGLTDQSAIVNFDIASPGGLVRVGEIVSEAQLVLADPPYGFQQWPQLFAALASAPADAVVVAETESRSNIHGNPPEGWESLRSREYGRTTVGFFVRRVLSAETSEHAVP
jgi:16S rRNA (guanine966-N2)-methyltransferase